MENFEAGLLTTAHWISLSAVYSQNPLFFQSLTHFCSWWDNCSVSHADNYKGCFLLRQLSTYTSHAP